MKKELDNLLATIADDAARAACQALTANGVETNEGAHATICDLIADMLYVKMRSSR